jgi:hypothetical protein
MACANYINYLTRLLPLKERKCFAQSALMFAVLITLLHLSFSFRMKVANSSGVLLSGWVPRLTYSSRIFGLASARAISLFRRSTISFGAPAGSRSPYHCVTS